MAVRRESVRLELEDAFSRGMLTAAAATKALESALEDLDGTTVDTTRTTNENTKSTDENTKSKDRSTRSTKALTLEQAIAAERLARLNRGLREQAKAAVDADSGVVAVTKDTDRLSVAAVRSSQSIDRFSGRMGILLKVAAVLGPALVPIGAVAIPAVTGLSAQLGFAALGMGALLIASQGVGDALKAVNDAALDPTVANLEKARDALKGLDPAAQAFIARFQEFRPVLADIRNSAAAGFFPGLTEALDSFERVAPRVADIFQVIGTTGGNLVADMAESLAGPEWSEFLEFVEREAPGALADLGHTVGNLAHGMAELWMAFSPVNNDFSDWLLDASRSFDEWSSGLSSTQGFQDFVDYLRENGPKVAEAAGAIANALVQIVQAAAPIAGPVLEAITGFANAVALIADSPLGTPIMAAVTAMSALSLATNVATAATVRLKAAQASLSATPVGAGAAAAKPGVAPVAPGPAGIATLVGFLNIPGELEHLQSILNGETGVVEGVARFAAAMQPAGQMAQLLGIDVLGTEKPFLKATVAAVDYSGALDGATGSQRHLGRSLFDTQRHMLQNARQSERLRGALQEEKKAARESAEGWTDYSQKVKLAGPSLDALMRRWRRLGAAAEDMGENMRLAIKRGVDPALIQNMIDTLGPMGAAGAIKELAHASKETRVKATADFLLMTGGANNYRQALRLAQEEISGTRAALSNLNRQRAEPKVDVDTGDAVNGVATVNQLLAGLDGNVAHTYVYTHHITTRTENSSPGFGPTGAADGGTVPKTGRAYADRHRYLLADGEEIISNRHGQADRHRSLLKAINAGRSVGGASRASERSMSSGGRGGVVRHVFEHRVTVVGEIDADKHVARLTQKMHEVSRDEIAQDRNFAESQV